MAARTIRVNVVPATRITGIGGDRYPADGGGANSSPRRRRVPALIRAAPLRVGRPGGDPGRVPASEERALPGKSDASATDVEEGGERVRHLHVGVIVAVMPEGCRSAYARGVLTRDVRLKWLVWLLILHRKANAAAAAAALARAALAGAAGAAAAAAAAAVILLVSQPLICCCCCCCC